MTALSLYVVYDHPSDFPHSFVVRRFEFDQPKELLGVAPSLELARLLIPKGLVCLHRLDQDERQIAEVWL